MKTSVGKKASVVLFAVILEIAWSFEAMAEPCCIIVVPPPPPPASQSPPATGSTYAQIPIFTALDFRRFDPTLKVEIQQKPFQDAVTAVISTRGTVGLGPVNSVARYKAETGADIEITAILINRPYFTLYSAAGLKMIRDLKEQSVAISSIGGLDHLFVAAALKANGIDVKAVKFLPVGPLPARAALEATTAAATVLPLSYDLFQPVKGSRMEVPKGITLPLWVLYASRLTLDSDRAEIGKLISSLGQTVKILRLEPSVAGKILPQRFKITDSKVQDIILKNLPAVLADNLVPQPKDVSEVVNTMRTLGLLKSEIQLFDPKRFK